MIARRCSQCFRSLLVVGTFAVGPAIAEAQSPQPVLMVIANRDYWHQEYAAVRSSLEARGLDVVVASSSLDAAIPQDKRPTVLVRPDVRVTEADASNYSAVVFVGGWGSSMYQYAASDPGTYAIAANRLIGDFVAQDKPVVALSHGVTVLAWARVEGVSPLAGRTVVAWAGNGPASPRIGLADGSVRAQLEANGAIVKLSASVGDPLSSHDDVVVDGRIITGENPASAPATGKTMAAYLLGK